MTCKDLREEICFFHVFIYCCRFLFLVDRGKIHYKIVLISGSQNVDIRLGVMRFSEMCILSQFSVCIESFEKLGGGAVRMSEPPNSQMRFRHVSMRFTL